MAQKPARKTGKKNRKHGRMAEWCKAYRARRQSERNQLRRVLRHLERHGADRMAVHCATNLKKSLGV